MFNLSPKQSRLALYVGLGLYVVIVAGVIAWLSANREDTIRRRMAQSPNVTVELPGQEAEVPASWATPPAAEEAKAPEAMPSPADGNQLPNDKAAQVPAAAGTEPASGNGATKAEPTPIATTGAQKWQKLARPFNQKDNRPRISLIVTDLGLAGLATQSAVQDLPADINLAFSAATPDLETWLSKAKAAGHESILTIPMEPNSYPQNDPGPNTLLLSLPDKENVLRIQRALSRGDGYVAVMPYMGEKFVTEEKKLAPVLDIVKQQQLLVLDNTMNKDSLIAPLSRLGRLPFVRSDMILDATSADAALDVQLQELEKAARAKGQAVAVVLPYPVAFEKLKTWIAGLEKKGLVLAPLTAMASEDVVSVPAAQ